MKYKIKEELLNLKDEEYRKFHSKLCPGTDNIIGVRVPTLRKYAKELIKQYEMVFLLNEIDDEYYEEIMLKGMIIGMIKDDFKAVKPLIEEFIPKIDNWAVCDIFCGGLKITKKYKNEMWEFIRKYLKSNKEFEIRFGIVMILDYYIEEDKIEEDFKIFDMITNDSYYVQMSVAWALSICLIKFFDRTLKYLETSKLDKFTYNKSIQKAIESYRISDDKKIILRSMKKM